MKSVGQIVYSPHSHLGSNQKWAVLLCDDEISRYYRHLFSMEHRYLNGELIGKLHRPIWGSHISWLRNEKVSNAAVWGLDNNKVIEFEYQDGVVGNGKYFWLPVSCSYLLDLRERLGLIRHPKFELHLTIGVLGRR